MAAVDTFTVAVRCSGNAPAGLIGKTKYNIIALTAANIVAQKAAALALANAEIGLSSGVLASSGIELGISSDPSYPGSVANRGEKWIVTAANTSTGAKYTYTIPALDETGNLESDNYTALLTSTAWAAYVTAFNAVAVDRFGQTLNVVTAKIGGRRR